MIQPIVNINGTDKGHLVATRHDAVKLVDSLIQVLMHGAPNGRDYPGRQDRFAEDRQTHYDRLYTLGALRDDLTREAVHILNQGKEIPQ